MSFGRLRNVLLLRKTCFFRQILHFFEPRKRVDLKAPQERKWQYYVGFTTFFERPQQRLLATNRQHARFAITVFDDTSNEITTFLINSQEKKHAVFAPSTVSVDSNEFAANRNELLLRILDSSEHNFHVFRCTRVCTWQSSRDASFSAMAIFRWFYKLF